MDILQQQNQQTENPEAYNLIISLLQKYQIKFTELEHKPVRTSIEAAQIRGVSLESGAKAMLLWKKTKIEIPINTDQFVLTVMSAAKKLSWKDIRKQLNYKQLDMATPEQVFQLTKCLSGAVPPFGSIFQLQTYLDQSLIDQGNNINFNAGLRTKSVSMAVEDYLQLEKPIIMKFTD